MYTWLSDMIYDFMYIRYHMCWIWFYMLFHTMISDDIHISYEKYQQNLSGEYDFMNFHHDIDIISLVHEIIGGCYDIMFSCDFICILVPARACTNAARAGSKAAPILFTDAPRFESIAAARRQPLLSRHLEPWVMLCSLRGCYIALTPAISIAI